MSLLRGNLSESGRTGTGWPWGGNREKNRSHGSGLGVDDQPEDADSPAVRFRADLPPPSPPVPGNRWRRAVVVSAVLSGLALTTSGCDPVINFYGSFFPGWVISVVLGITLCVLSRWFFAVTRMEPHLGPLILVYPALAFLWSCLSWLALFGP